MSLHTLNINTSSCLSPSPLMPSNPDKITSVICFWMYLYVCWMYHIYSAVHLLLWQTPFILTLRLWDIYMLEGEKILTAMAYIALKLHKSEYEDEDEDEDDIILFAGPCGMCSKGVREPSFVPRYSCSWVLPCTLHCTLPLCWLPPKWMAYIMQVAGCCGEQWNPNFSLDARSSSAAPDW